MWALQNLDIEDFVTQYWQKKPCVIREAFADFELPVAPEELAGLACEEDVHCRLVIERDDGSWQLRYGPFEERDFLALPERNYSLLVSECEKWMPELNALLDSFRFIPDWRIDDLMLSYAPEGGSVGPHVDEYDVFLLQASGARRWRYGAKRLENPVLIPDLELAILEEFNHDHEIELHPGDMLYLPPGIAHHGVALEPCMTCSIGFRAPTAASVLESFALETERLDQRVQRYTDPELELDRHSAEISNNEIARLRTLASGLMQEADALWPDAVGKLLSDSAVVAEVDDDQPVFISDLLAADWLRHPETRLLFHQTADAIRVYYNGRAHALPQSPEVLACVQQLCQRHEWSQALIKRCIEVEPIAELLLELATNGAIISDK